MHLVDEYEPREIEALIMQVFADTARGPLNREGYADYLFTDWNDKKEQFERKQVGEILSDMNGVEYQLRREVDKLRETNLIMEGIVTPSNKGEIQTWLTSSNGRIIRPGHRYSFPYTRLEGWLWGIEDAGITVWRTNDRFATADAIVMRMKHVLRQDHNALSRHLKQMPHFSPNPHVQTLMGIKDANLGPERAEALVAAFGTTWDILRCDADIIATVEGIGLQTAKKLLNAVGRKV
jgi:hypothetical protein